MALVSAKGVYFDLRPEDLRYIESIKGEGETLEQVIERLWAEEEYENPNSTAIPKIKRKPNPSILDYYIKQ